MALTGCGSGGSGSDVGPADTDLAGPADGTVDGAGDVALPEVGDLPADPGPGELPSTDEVEPELPGDEKDAEPETPVGPDEEGETHPDALPEFFAEVDIVFDGGELPDVQPPESCASDEECAEWGLVCDPLTEKCIECASSKDCPGEDICDQASGKCVGCVTNEDCGEGKECSAGKECVTVTPCDSDKDCTPLGMVCDKANGVCRECVEHSDCTPDQYCAGNTCLQDVCAPEAASCVGNTVSSCTPEGGATVAVQECGPSQSCTELWPDAWCADWVCEAGMSYCGVPDAPETAVVCSGDGLEVLSQQDCSAVGQACWGGQCLDVVCVEGEIGCDEAGLELTHCDEHGTAVVPEPCPEGTFCQMVEPGKAQCVPQACKPNLPVCSGNLATACAANGSGILPGGTDCGTDGAYCAGGECVPCQGIDVCDGLDNNCNGLFDELTPDCQAPLVCHSGKCFGALDPKCTLAVYSGHIYMLCKSFAVSWMEAKALCASWNGATLIVLNDLAEQQFLSFQTSNHVWIGISDAAVEGVWEWEACCSTFTYWCDWQPDNGLGGEDCAAANFQNFGPKAGCWNDWTLSDATKLTEFMCEVQ